MTKELVMQIEKDGLPIIVVADDALRRMSKTDLLNLITLFQRAQQTALERRELARDDRQDASDGRSGTGRSTPAQ